MQENICKYIYMGCYSVELVVKNTMIILMQSKCTLGEGNIDKLYPMYVKFKEVR